MRTRCLWSAAAFCFVALALSASAANGPKDVPAGHWARPAVLAVTDSGVMMLQNNAFHGEASVTRIELAQAIERWVRAIEAGKWQDSTAVPNRLPKRADWRKAKITRYELAATLDRLATYASLALKKNGTFGNSEALGPKADISRIPRKSPAYQSLRYLAQNRMVSKTSILLKPTKDRITGEQLSACLTSALAGLCDRLTDEPQNRTDIPRPAEKH